MKEKFIILNTYSGEQIGSSQPTFKQAVDMAQKFTTLGNQVQVFKEVSGVFRLTQVVMEVEEK